MPSGLRVGLTGGIACGKSVVTRGLADAGIATLDLDVIAHEVMAPGGPAHAEVVAAFGEGILAADGGIDRKALGVRVFGDDDARRRLDGIVHPAVRLEESRRVAALAHEPGNVVVTDAALLVEAGVHLRFDRLVVVHCRPEVQLQRLIARDGIGADAAAARLRAQMPIAEKRRFAHLEVDTNGSIEQTLRQAEELAASLRSLARRPRGVSPLRPLQAIACLALGPRQGPHGLTPTAVLRDLISARGIEMERLRALVSPPRAGPWFRAAPATEEGPPPATLAGAMTLWVLAHGTADEDVLLAAAASVARLTHRSSLAIGNACVLALAMLAASSAATGGRSLELQLSEWRARARRWAGGDFDDTLRAVLRSADECPADVEAARFSVGNAGSEAELAGALIGLRSGAAVSAPAEVEELVGALMATGSRAEG